MPIPKIVASKRVKRGSDFKGGLNGYEKVKKDVKRLLGDSNAAMFTTLFDYYALPEDFPGMDTLPPGDPRRRVEYLENAFREDFDDPRFKPYLMLHEFEAWLFSDVQAWAWVVDDDGGFAELGRVREGVASPEEIDDGPETAPSKRILATIPGYQKALHGPMAVSAIGLETIRSECPHFGEWLSRLEALGS